MILNLTQHKASCEQRKAGVIDLPKEYRTRLQDLLTFDELPTKKVVQDRVMKILELVYKYLSGNVEKWENIIDDIMQDELEKNKINAFMIGGALWLMKPMIEDYSHFTKVVFAFSKREVIEKDDVKTSVFKHIGFIDANIDIEV